MQCRAEQCSTPVAHECCALVLIRQAGHYCVREAANPVQPIHSAVTPTLYVTSSTIVCCACVLLGNTGLRLYALSALSWCPDGVQAWRSLYVLMVPTLLPGWPVKKSKAAPLPWRSFLSTRFFKVTLAVPHRSTTPSTKPRSKTGQASSGLLRPGPWMVTFLQEGATAADGGGVGLAVIWLAWDVRHVRCPLFHYQLLQ